jgi:excisionase family DNA binding protein
MERQTYTIDEAARILGIGRNAGYLAARSGALPVLRMGKRLLVPRAALERLLGEAKPDTDPKAIA